MTTFLLPDFEKGKVHDFVDIISPNALLVKECKNYGRPAISSRGFSSKTDGVYVTVLTIHEMSAGGLDCGFTDTKAFDTTAPEYVEITGTNIYCANGITCPQYIKYMSKDITRECKEIISIFTISNNGAKKEIRWYFDGNDGGDLDCTDAFEQADEIFPYVSLGENGLLVEFVPFDHVFPLSPEIEELKKEFTSKRKQQTISTSAPSTSTAENDALICQLRDQVARSQDALLADRDARIRTLLVLLAAQTKEIEAKNNQLQSKDQFLERTVRETRQDLIQQAELSQKQLELERAEHQKTRNLLHQTKMEMKDMEITYLTREKESGQRRQRDEEK